MQKEQNTKKPNAFSRAFSKCFNSIDNVVSSFGKSLIFLTVYSFVINFLLEFSLRQSVFDVFRLIFSAPLTFLLGAIIVFTSFTAMYFFKRHGFVFLFISILWYSIAFINFFIMVLSQRPDPFNISDIFVFFSTFNIIKNGYLDFFAIILIAIVIVLIISILTYSFIKGKKSTGFFGKSAYVGFISFAVMLSIVVSHINLGVDKNRHDSPLSAFREHGYAFCFLYSMIDSGIDKPENYTSEGFAADRDKINNLALSLNHFSDENFTSQFLSRETTDSIFDIVKSEYTLMPKFSYLNVTQEQANKVIDDLSSRYEAFIANHSAENQGNANCKTFKKPNIVYLQLESFYDVNNIEGYSYSSNPIPIFTLLKENLPGGKLSVPSLGAGTANTEFEIMTGMDKTYFSFTEYPYFTVLKDQTCESIAYNAKEYGYKSHVIHNHEGSFYDRNLVYPNLGFDTFTSIESFPNIVTNPRSWCKDDALIEPILASLKSTEEQDLVYAISVQPHGKYPSAEIYNQILGEGSAKITVSGNELNPENPGFSYYVNQINEVDTFIGRLLLELSMIEEPTVVVMYGDHLPSFSLEKYWSLKQGDYFQTDYVIWNNCGIDFSDAKDLKTYQLSSYLFSKIGIDSGDINLLNRLYLDNDLDDEKQQYAELLHKYEYATFEDKSLRDPASPIRITTYKPTTNVTGVISPKIDHIYTIGDERTIILGDNYNRYSTIVVDGEKINTTFISRNILTTSDEIPVGTYVSVQQLGGNNIFGKSQSPVLYSYSMIVKNENVDEVRQLVLEYYNLSDTIKNEAFDDATLDFITGQDEFDMIQDDRPGDN